MSQRRPIARRYKTCYEHILAPNQENDCEGSFDNAGNQDQHSEAMAPMRWMDILIQRDYNQVSQIRSAVLCEFLSAPLEEL